MLEETGYCDIGVVDEFTNGAELTGCIGETELWPKKFQPATTTPAELHDTASKERSRLLRSHLFPSNELNGEIWKQTLEEKTASWLEGPLDISSLLADYPLSRRFAITQGTKIRCMDDFSMLSVNSCVQSTESPKSHTADVLEALCSCIMR